MHAWGMGGTIRTTLNVAGHLAQSHDVEILSLVRRRDDPFFAFPPGVTVTAIDDQRPDALPPLTRLARRWLSRFGSVLLHPADRGAHHSGSLWLDIGLARAFHKRTNGVLIGTRPGLNLLAVAAASPSLVKIGQEHMNLSAHPRPLRRAVKRGYKALDALVALTQRDLDAYHEAIGEGPALHVIPNATPDLGGRRSDGSARTVIAAGRLTRQKGFARLIAAFAPVVAAHPDWRLEIYGRGPRRKRLQRRIDNLGLAGNVTLAGPVEDIGAAMAAASIFALSSRFEGFPMVLLEAMSVGLPVVSFDCPTGPREIVEDRRNGLLVRRGDVGALAEALVEMIDDEELRRRCSEGAVRTAERYSLDAIGPRWDQLISELRVSSPG
jgi:glycosyltransferase involved in cell wall biosynthesis